MSTLSTDPTHKIQPRLMEGVQCAYLSLGANIGNRRATILQAYDLIAADPNIELLHVSRLYATEPVGYVDQPEFLNCAAVVATSLAPEVLLNQLRAIEQQLGRTQRQQWHEREIDIDIVLMDTVVVNRDDLVIPHPEMHRRRFVLAPLATIAPDAVHPLLKSTVRELLEQCVDESEVRELEGRI